MAAEQRKLLEQLMGDTLMGSASAKEIPPITDYKVCRSYLAGTCPHDLFTNTKGDIGPCTKLHSEKLKQEYDAADDAQKAKWSFTYDYMKDMQRYIDDCNRKIDTAHRRLDKTPEEIRQGNELTRDISDFNKTISAGLAEVEMLCEVGAVNIAVTEFFKIRQAQQVKMDRERDLKQLHDNSGPSGHQKLQVCDVCGAYLSRLDNDRRLADHFFGKMHLGYAQMRKAAEALQAEWKQKGAPQRDDYPVNGGQRDDGWGGGRGGGFGGRGGGYRGGGGGFGGGRGRGRGGGFQHRW